MISALDLSPEMMLELALGLEPPLAVIAKHGVSAADFQTLQTQAWFLDALTRERERLRDEGYTFQAKARLMNEEILKDLYIDAKSNAMKPELKLELSKHLADMTGMRKPAGGPAVAAGPAFAITINIPDNARGPVNIGELLAVKHDKPAPMVIEMTPSEPKFDLGPKPVGVPDFRLTNDLVGPPLQVSP